MANLRILSHSAKLFPYFFSFLPVEESKRRYQQQFFEKNVNHIKKVLHKLLYYKFNAYLCTLNYLKDSNYTYEKV